MKKILTITLLSGLWALVGALPPAVEELQPKQWTAIPQSNLIMVGAPQDSYPLIQHNYGVAGVMRTWSGGTYDPVHDALIIFGGGHNGYGGNEIYRFLMQTLKWERVTDPTPDPNRCTQEAEPGVPISRHTYGGLCYITHANRFFALGGSPDCGAGGCGLDIPWTFNFETKTWSKVNAPGDSPNPACEDNNIYWPENGRVYHHANGTKGWHAYDYNANTWTKLNSYGDAYGRSLALDPKRKVIVEIGSGAAYQYDLTSPALARTTLSLSGDNFITGQSNPGLAYDPVSDRIIGWHGGADVYALDLDAKTWTKHAPAAYNTITPTAVTAEGGTYGRFQYVPSRNVFVAVNTVFEPVFIYKFTAGAGTARNGEAAVHDAGIAINVSPNPFKSRTVITISKKFRVPSFELQIFDITGKQLETRNLKLATRNSFSWNASALPAGIYLLKVSLGKKQVTKRLFLTK